MTATDLDQPTPRPEAPSSIATDAAAEAERRPTPNSRATLTVGEAAGIGAVLLVASIGAVSLLLAQLGQHDGWLALLLGTVLTATLAFVGLILGGRVSLQFDKVELGLLAATLVAAGVAFLPGFPYAYADKDPGVYVTHAFAIARGGDVAVPDEIEQHGLDESTGSRTSFPGAWPAYRDDDATTSQFYHYISALMATADDIGGPRALFNLTPVLAMLSVVLIVLAARRAAGTSVAAITALLLVSSMIQVWQAKYPSSEMPAQLILSGVLLAAVLAMDRRWAGGGFIAGLLLGVGFLTRPDGFLYILLAAAVAALVIAVGHADRRLVALGIGLGITLPGALWNAYQLRRSYSEINSVPGPILLLAACIALIAGGFAVRAVQRRRRFDLLALAARRHQLIGAAAAALFGLVLLVLWNRNTLFGQSYLANGFTGVIEPNLNEFNLRWLSLYISLPGLALMWFGFGVTALRRPKPSLYLLLLPGTLLLPLYIWEARVSLRMMWWVRRYVPAVLPAIMLLIAVGLAWALWHRRWVLKVAAVGALTGLVVFFASQSGPLRNHREMGGSWDMAAAVAAPAGDERGVFLFERPDAGNIFDPLRNTPLGVWWIFGQTSAWLPEEFDMETIEAYQDAFPDRPVFVVSHDALPESLPEDEFENAGGMVNELIVWEEWPWGVPAEGAPAQRPDNQLRMPQRLVIWQVVD
ncbi:MAG: glycosyltransferase family 39 protein [Acidimicrobiales bacterium]